MEKLAALKQYFGHSAFRPGQETMVDALLSGRDAFGVMPTGAGKSVCYQLPALLLPGVTLVISPLISLMKDQVTALEQAGLPAAFLNSSQTTAAQREVLRGLKAGAYKLLYVAPERLTADSFLDMIHELELSLIVVDEAHCVSQWGQDFRPGYLDIAGFIRTLDRRPPVGAFTATATEQVRQDIVRLLELRHPAEVITGFDRPNLFFEVRQPRSKDACLLELLEKRRDQSGIVYCSTRKNVERVQELLVHNGFAAARYHAGLTDEERHRSQEDFLYDRVRVMAATNAFGMGIDKSNVNYVIHYNMPRDLESYYQEAGRAGRDGSPADCILLYAPGDVNTARFMIENSQENEKLTPEEQKRITARDFQRLNRMVGYCRTGGCLRAYLLRYFGEKAPDQCGNCGSCLGETVEEDITVQAQKILSCVVRAEKLLGYSLGRSSYIQILRGSEEKRLLEKGLDQLSTYGILQEPASRLQDYFAALESQGYLEARQEHSTVTTTPLARKVLFQGQTVRMRTRHIPEERLAAHKMQEFGPVNEALFQSLRRVRMAEARKAGVPAYAIFSDAALRAMAAARPRTEAEFLAIPGVGEVKLRRFGSLFLEEIRKSAEK